MTAECAFSAHRSSQNCAHYAQDLAIAPVHNSHMGIDWFKARKSELELNDADIAKLVGRERSVINKALNGKKGIEPSYIDGLAKALKASKLEILYHAGYIDELPNVPSETELAAMIAEAQDEVGIEALTIGGYPTAVAAGLRERLLRYSGARPNARDVASETSTSRDEGARSRPPTKRSSPGL